jgi:tripartite ATP-independent transporter DctM subunit
MADVYTNSDEAAVGAPDLSRLGKAIDVLSDGAGLVSALALLGMTVIVCYEVISRSIFNEPTTWVTEISTYVFVAVVFLGLASAQKANRHIQVEILVSQLSPEWRARAELVGLWTGLAFMAIATWQTARFTFLEYVHDTRDWGLLATPQWIPQLPITLGFAFFILAMLRDIHRLSVPRAGLSEWAPLVAAGIAVITLIWLGRSDVRINGTWYDWGTVTIAVSVLVSMVAWSGVNIALAVTALYGSLAGLFYSVQDASSGGLAIALIGTLLVLLLLGVRIGIAMGVIGMLGLLLLLPKPHLPIIADRAWTSVNTFTLTAIPTFVLMGSFLIRSAITTELFDALVCWFGRARGGLAHASIGAAAVFAAVSGSSLATAATLGSVAAPEMVSRGYSPRLTYGVIGAGATLGILIPPSIAMIIYGNVVGAPVTVLFIAGIIPGLLLASLFMMTVLLWSFAAPGSVPPGRSYPIREKIVSLLGVLPAVLLIIAVLGSLYAGIASPTEAGAVGAAIAFLLCVVRRKLTWSGLLETAIETVRVTAFIMLIVVCAAIYSWVFDYLRLPRELVAAVRDAQLEPWLVMTLICAVYLALGTIIESISMMLMTLSVTFPIVASLGFDPIWFGVVLVILVEVGLLTPPVGIVLFVLRGMSNNVPLSEIALGALPFVILMLGFIAVLYAFPEIVTWLPSRMG